MNVSELYIHPLKSAAALRVSSLDYTPLGPEYDRNWVVVDANGMFLSQRKFPKMCLIRANVYSGNLVLNAPQMQECRVYSDNHSDARTNVIVWGDQIDGLDCGDESAAWMSNFLDRDCRLVRVDGATQRRVDPDYASQGQLVSFADGFPTLIATQASLEEFNSHLESPIKMQRFRPNIVIQGSDAYAEDHWRKIKIGSMTFELVKPCSRCIMPSINPETAEKEMAINQVLLKTRRGSDGKTYFGQNALHQGLEQIHIGDPVEVLEVNDPR